MQAQTPKKALSSAHKHRRQVAWQILVPILLAAVIIIGLGVLMSLPAGATTTGQWAAISLIWLILPVLPLVLIFFAVTVAMIFGIARLMRILPKYTRLVDLYIQIFNVHLNTFSNRVVAPVLKIRGWQAGWAAFWRSLRRKRTES